MQFTRLLPGRASASAPAPEKYMVGITGDSAEAVAYALLERIAEAEHWLAPINLPNGPKQRWNKTKEEILDTFAECYRAARGLDWRTS